MYSSFFEWMIELAWWETQQFGQATRRWRWIGPLRMRAGGQQGAGQSVEARIRVRVMSRRLRRSPLTDQVRDPHPARSAVAPRPLTLPQPRSRSRLEAWEASNAK